MKHSKDASKNNWTPISFYIVSLSKVTCVVSDCGFVQSRQIGILSIRKEISLLIVSPTNQQGNKSQRFYY